jgi:hypothetical protein
VTIRCPRITSDTEKGKWRRIRVSRRKKKKIKEQQTSYTELSDGILL